MHQCKICSSSALNEIYDDQFDIQYYLCEVCEYIFQDNEDIVSIKEEKKIYDQHDNSFESEGYVKMFKDFIKKGVNPFLKERAKALEFGCGPGPVLAKLLEMDGWDVTTYDPIYDDNTHYKEETYDLITSTEVFEHFSDPLKEIKHLSTLLKPGGILSIMTLLHPKTKEAFKDWWYKRDITHISFYSSKTLYLLGKMYDLEMIYNDNKRIITFKKV